MANIKIETPISIEDDEEVQKINTIFDGFTSNWSFSFGEFLIKSRVLCKKQPDTVYPLLIKHIKNSPEKSQDDLILVKEYEELINNGGQIFEYNASIQFELQIPFVIDIKRNTISSKRLNLFYEEELRKLAFALVMSILLTTPDFVSSCGTVSIYFDDELYRNDSFFEVDNHHCATIRYEELFRTELSIYQTFNWIKQYTNLLNTTNKSPVIFGALTYILNRQCHESLIYSIIALESIYSPNSKGISNTLQKRITTVFPTITKEQIKQMYAKRSKYVHGEIKMGLFPFDDEVIEDDMDFSETATLATAMVVESLRLLIANNSTAFVFHENITFNYL